jgi:hypothetical protein
MSKIILRTVGTAALLALSTTAFTGTALAWDKGGNDNASAVGCSASNSQSQNLVPVNLIASDAINGNNVLSNCPANASAG